MSRETAGDSVAAGERGLLASADPPSAATVQAGGAAVGLLAVAAVTTLRVANNLPGSLPAPVASLHGAVETAGPFAIVAAAVAVGAATRDPARRVGLVVAGVFGGVGLVAPGTSVPVVAAVVGGGGVAVHRAAARNRRAVAVATPVLAGLVLSFGSAAGLLDVGFRPLGSTLAFLGVAALPLVVDPPTRSWLLGGGAAALVLAAGIASPFVAGSVALVAFASVGPPLLVMAVGVGGGVTAATGALDDRRWLPAVGAGLLLFAAVPASLPRALAVVLGLALLLGGEQA